ncbi:MAG: ATP-binding protein [Anaerolineales bacterium]|nr:ATP-binding protein [Anaerolineales bacterium]MCS7246739.1 ATP-binding protein [Anaerolineales bacterium]MDW8160549.1 ATP-binding protein [Anaerolineales bacterium]MDW8447338.1 ATP-binding protein [Anaerolineales bacterium]
MTKKFILAFTSVVLIPILIMVWITRQTTASEVRAFMFPGGMVSREELIRILAEYYQAQGSWSGVETLFATGGRRWRHEWQWGQWVMPAGSGMMHGMMGRMNQRLQIADEEGRVVYDSLNQNIGTKWSAEYLRFVDAIRVENRTVGYLAVEGGMIFSYADERQLLARLNRAAIVAAVTAGGIGLVVAILLSYSLGRPIRELTQAAAQIRSGNLSQRVRVRSQDEIGILAATFNQMADALEKAEQARQRMTADIAHELRNPLAVQRAHLEAMIDGVYPLSIENLQIALEQNQLLLRLVEDLRTLALAESGHLPLDKTTVNVAELIARIGEMFHAQAMERQIRLSLPDWSKDNFSSLEVLGDPMRLEQILGNLLSNALRYTPAGGEIAIGLEKTREQVKIMVKDSGPGIPEKDLPHIFERFYRADRSRSRAEGGSGLGLTIARNLAVAHGGWLEAMNSPRGGAIFILSLPTKRKEDAVSS